MEGNSTILRYGEFKLLNPRALAFCPSGKNARVGFFEFDSNLEIIFEYYHFLCIFVFSNSKMKASPRMIVKSKIKSENRRASNVSSTFPAIIKFRMQTWGFYIEIFAF